ncbi:MAG TPA: cytochrome C oxidase subunit IV family protein [Chitinophagales bacterium]|nr:cytochrome C oxidase subunit IV family protein [Chitinophagales bacterium]
MDFEEPVQGHLHWTDGEYSDGRKEVLKTIIVLSVVTIAEVSIAISYDELVKDGGKFRWLISLLMAIFSVVKVIYIMGTFMHLKHEKKGFQMSVLLPFLFLVWAIIAFTLEGSSWEYMRTWLNMF